MEAQQSIVGVDATDTRRVQEKEASRLPVAYQIIDFEIRMVQEQQDRTIGGAFQLEGKLGKVIEAGVCTLADSWRCQTLYIPFSVTPP